MAMNSIGLQNSYGQHRAYGQGQHGGGSSIPTATATHAAARQQQQILDNYCSPFTATTSKTSAAAGVGSDNSNQAGLAGNGKAGSGLYSNSNRNLITQKFAPVGIPPCNSSHSSYGYNNNSGNGNSNGNGSSSSIRDRDISLGNGNANSNNSQSFGAANNNITNTSTGTATGFGGVSASGNSNSHLSPAPDPLLSPSYSSNPISGIGNGEVYKSSPITNGSYQADKNSGSDLRIPYQPQQPWPTQTLNTRLARPGAVSSRDTDSWSKSCLYDTGSTIENLAASARESVAACKSKWGPTREEMKDQLASSMAADNIRILPGFESRSSSSSYNNTGQVRNSIHYGGREDKEPRNRQQNTEKRPVSPVTRAQNAIGQTRRELGQVQSMMEMNGGFYGAAGSGLMRQARGRHCFSLDSESLLMKRTKQQSYRADLERQIEQSRARKNEMRRLDMEGDHPLGVQYNSPIPRNYLEDCLRSPRNMSRPQPQAPIVKDYSKYLELMANRDTIPDDRRPKPHHVQAANAKRGENVLQQPRNAQMNLNPFMNNPSPQRPVHNSPTMASHQQQEQLAAYQAAAQAQQYYQAYYQQYPFYNGYGTPPPIPAATPGGQYPPAAPSMSTVSSEQAQRQMPVTPEDFHDAQPVNNRQTKATTGNSPRRDHDFEEDDAAEGELEQSMRLHVWQESDQMPSQDLKMGFYKRDLMKQIVEKRREQMERKRREEEEDARLERKILDYQEQMRKEVDQEKSQRLSEIKSKKHATSSRNLHQQQVQPQRLAAKGPRSKPRHDGGGDKSSKELRSTSGSSDTSNSSASMQRVLSHLTLPTLARANATVNSGAGDNRNHITRPGMDLKVLGNLNKVLHKEAKRVDQVLQEKRPRPRRVA